MATIKIPNNDKYQPIGPTEPVTFYFEQQAFFQTKDGDSFNPPLSVGMIPAGTTAKHIPAKGSENSDVLYCYTLGGGKVSACKDPISNPTNLAGHVIHIGSGGSSTITRKEIVAFEKALEAVSRKAAFADLWPSTKSLIVALLKVKPAIPSRFRVVLQVLAMTGDAFYLKIKKPM